MAFEMKGGGFGAKSGGFGPKNGGGFGPKGGGGNEKPLDPNHPLKDVKYTGYLDEDMSAQLLEMQKGFEERAKKERQRVKRTTSDDYWFAVHFETPEQKRAFLSAMGIKPKLMGDRYIDGTKWARQAKIDLPEP